MFYAIVFKPVDFGRSVARPLRKSPYKTLKSAIKGVTRSGLEGYIKQYGVTIPVWNNTSRSSVTPAIKGY